MEDSALLAAPSVTDSTSLTAESYKRAQRLYVTKKFYDSYETLAPLIENGKRLRESDQLTEQTWINCWKLYFLLIDSAARPGSDGDWPKKVRRDLAARISDGSLWNEAVAAFDGLENANLQITRALFLLAAKHSENIDVTAEKMENLLATLSGSVYQFDPASLAGYTELQDTYALRILPKKGEFELAREFIAGNAHYDPGKKEELRAKIDSYEKEYHARKTAEAEELERQKKLESQRVANARSRGVQSSKSPGTVSPPASSGVSPVHSRNDSLPTPVPRAGSPSKSTGPRIQGFAGLVAHWSQYASDLARSRSLLQILLAICVIILSMANPKVRDRITRMLAPLYLKLKDTARMAFKVSYV